MLGSLVANALCLLLVVLFSKFVFQANWGDHLGIIFIILLTEVFLAISFGLGIGYITKTGESSRAIIMVVVQLASIFGGAYFIVEENVVTNLSPLTWANTAIMKIIYANDIGAALPVISLNLGISALFLLIAIIALRRRRGYSMKDILWLIQKTLSVLLKNKKGLLIIISLPIIGTLISFSIYGNVGQGTLNIGVINKENQPIANDTVKFLEGLNHVNVSKVKESEVEDKLTSKKLDGVITLDSGFSESVREGKPSHIEISSIKGDQVTGFIKSYLYNYVDTIAAISKVAGTDQSTFDNMYAGYQKVHLK